MKLTRLLIVLTTLTLAGFAGTTPSSLLESAACRVDAVAGALGGSAQGGSCQQ